MRVLCALGTATLLVPLTGCGFGAFLNQAAVGFAEAFGAYGAGLLIDGFGDGTGPGPFCIGPGCGETGSGSD